MIYLHVCFQRQMQLMRASKQSAYRMGRARALGSPLENVLQCLVSSDHQIWVVSAVVLCFVYTCAR